MLSAVKHSSPQQTPVCAITIACFTLDLLFRIDKSMNCQSSSLCSISRTDGTSTFLPTNATDVYRRILSIFRLLLPSNNDGFDRQLNSWMGFREKFQFSRIFSVRKIVVTFLIITRAWKSIYRQNIQPRLPACFVDFAISATAGARDVGERNV